MILKMVISTPLVIFAIHCLLNRVLRKALSTQACATLACLLGCAGVIAFAARTGTLSETVFATVNGLLLGHFYFHLFNMSETARRIKIVLLFHRNTNAAVVSESYAPEELVEQRIERLLILRQAKQENGKIVATGRLLLLVARVMMAYERLLFPLRLHFRVSPAALQAGEVDGKLGDSLKVAK